MILRLRLNEMDLQRSKQMLAFLQRQPDYLRQIFGHGRATADLMNANGPVRSDQLQHDPPLHPELPATTTGQSHSTPTSWTVSKGKAAADNIAALKKGDIADRAAELLAGTGWLPAMLRAA
jgi:hypothetical protein